MSVSSNNEGPEASGGGEGSGNCESEVSISSGSRLAWAANHVREQHYATYTRKACEAASTNPSWDAERRA